MLSNFMKNTKNYRWKVRYDNLNKKTSERISELEKLLDNDTKMKEIKYLQDYCKYLKRQRDSLREENLKLIRGK